MLRKGRALDVRMRSWFAILLAIGIHFASNAANPEAILDKIRDFQETTDTYQFIEDVARFGPTTSRGDPDLALDTWIAILNVLEEKIDPAFNPAKRAFRNLDPPPGSGIQAGESPAAIKDPELRRQHEAALQRNSEYGRYYVTQIKCRELKSIITRRLAWFLHLSYLTQASLNEALIRLKQGFQDKQLAVVLAAELRDIEAQNAQNRPK